MMRKTFKRALSLVLAVLVLASMACVVASANSGQNVNNKLTDIITSTEGTNTYYFYMPDSWKNQYNDTYVEGDESSYSAGIYWWEGTGNCEDNPNAEGNGWPGYNVTEQVAPNVFAAHVPTDVTTIIWNNTVNGGTDNTLPEYTAAIQSSNIPSEYFDPDDATDTYKFFPEGTENFDGMIYVCDPEATEINEYSGKATYKGSWLYYYGDGKYGVQKTLEEAEAADAVYSNGEFPVYGFQISDTELTVYTNGTGTITPNKSNCTATIADETVATIAQDEVTGVVTVTPVKVGTTTVTFTYTDGADVTTKDCVITVKEPPTEINVAAKSVYVKKTVKLGAKVVNGKGTTSYKSSNTKIAKVDNKGNVTGVKAGKATITVTNNKVSEKVTVTVKNPVVKIGGKTVTAGKTLNTS
ncbi:MAG: Ig-like domain-containing protein, partial [Ruminococcus sp.]